MKRFTIFVCLSHVAHFMHKSMNSTQLIRFDSLHGEAHRQYPGYNIIYAHLCMCMWLSQKFIFMAVCSHSFHDINANALSLSLSVDRNEKFSAIPCTLVMILLKERK